MHHFLLWSYLHNIDTFHQFRYNWWHMYSLYFYTMKLKNKNNNHILIYYKYNHLDIIYIHLIYNKIFLDINHYYNRSYLDYMDICKHIFHQLIYLVTCNYNYFLELFYLQLHYNNSNLIYHKCIRLDTYSKYNWIDNNN